jgi:hypothetical protein
MSELDGKVVDTPIVAAVPPAPPEPTPEQIETTAKAWLKDKHGIEDPAEIETYRSRARQADEYERALRQPPRQYVQPPAPSPPSQPAGQMSREEWQEIEQLGRINPAAATVRIMAQFNAEREARESANRQQQTHQTVAMISAAQAFRDGQSGAETWIKSEFPEAMDGRSKLNKEAARVWDTMPWLAQHGDGMRTAVSIAAANLGEIPRSKRPAPSTSRAEVEAQSPERGTKRPAPDTDDTPATARERRIAAQMGIDPKRFRARRRELAESEKGK